MTANDESQSKTSADPIEDGPEEESGQRKAGFVEFFKVFFTTKAAPQIFLLSFFLSFGLGSTVGVLPDVLSDRFARLHHGYTGSDCSNFERLDKPDACQQGADDAQGAAAIATFWLNILTLLTNSTVGSVSDARGRRGIMILSLLLSALAPAMLVLMQISSSIDPVWFFVAFALSGLVNWTSIGFSMLSDVIPPHYRAPSFGLFLSAYYLGMALSPSFALLMDHFQVSVLSLASMSLGLLYAGCALPETLPDDVAEYNLAERTGIVEEGREARIRKTILRPIREMSILNRDALFRLLTIAYFLSGMVYSSDRSLVLFYIEDQLNVRDGDLAKMFLVMGFVGVVMQGCMIEPLLMCLGEKRLLVVSFISGTFHNLLYGLAKSKSTIYVALCLSQLTKTNFPLISSIASNNVSENEQGRMQGALFALSALADAIGPVSLQLVYNYTKDGKGLGPGTMFVVAGGIYAVGTLVVSLIPSEKANADITQDRNENDIEEPLLGGS